MANSFNKIIDVPHDKNLLDEIFKNVELPKKDKTRWYHNIGKTGHDKVKVINFKFEKQYST